MKLYVGNLPYNTTEDDLRNLFSQYGSVDSVAVITDRETGRSKGSASWNSATTPKRAMPFRRSPARNMADGP